MPRSKASRLRPSTAPSGIHETDVTEDVRRMAPSPSCDGVWGAALRWRRSPAAGEQRGAVACGKPPGRQAGRAAVAPGPLVAGVQDGPGRPAPVGSGILPARTPAGHGRVLRHRMVERRDGRFRMKWFILLRTCGPARASEALAPDGRERSVHGRSRQPRRPTGDDRPRRHAGRRGSGLAAAGRPGPRRTGPGAGAAAGWAAGGRPVRGDAAGQRVAGVLGAADVRPLRVAVAWRSAGGVARLDALLPACPARRVPVRALDDPATGPPPAGAAAPGAAAAAAVAAADRHPGRLDAAAARRSHPVAAGAAGGLGRRAVLRGRLDGAAAAALARRHRPPARGRPLRAVPGEQPRQRDRAAGLPGPDRADLAARPARKAVGGRLRAAGAAGGRVRAGAVALAARRRRGRRRLGRGGRRVGRPDNARWRRGGRGAGRPGRGSVRRGGGAAAVAVAGAVVGSARVRAVEPDARRDQLPDHRPGADAAAVGDPARAVPGELRGRVHPGGGACGGAPLRRGGVPLRRARPAVAADRRRPHPVRHGDGGAPGRLHAGRAGVPRPAGGRPAAPALPDRLLPVDRAGRRARRGVQRPGRPGGVQRPDRVPPGAGGRVPVPAGPGPPLRFGLSVTALLAVSTLVATLASDGVLLRDRSFFGVLEVARAADGRYRNLTNGTTLHGAEVVEPGQRPVPITYYSPRGPIGDVVRALHARGRTRRVAVIGVGAGAMACHSRPGERWTFLEIDPKVERIASNPRLFTYLRDCQGSFDVVLGDARVSLTRSPQRRYGLIVLDAFSSDAIPVHLLTKEAVELYRSRLEDGGVLAFHISNRFIDLEPVLGDVARATGMTCVGRFDHAPPLREPLATSRISSIWVALARRPADLGAVASDPNWQPCSHGRGSRPWTDDYSNVLTALLRGP